LGGVGVLSLLRRITITTMMMMISKAPAPAPAAIGIMEPADLLPGGSFVALAAATWTQTQTYKQRKLPQRSEVGLGIEGRVQRCSDG